MPPPAAPPVFPRLLVEAEAAAELDLAAGIAAARGHLLGLQRADGHWCGELEGDTILESEYVLLQAFLGRLRHPKIAGCARYLLAKQEPHGGWGNYPGGPADLSATVKAYFALKLAGHSPDEAPLQKAREVVRRLGGAERCNSFTRFSLAALGQLPYAHCPSVPVELVRLPLWFPLSIYRMSAWTRTMVVPLALVQFFKPAPAIPAALGIAELFLDPTRQVAPPAARLASPWLSWANFFRLGDRLVKFCERFVPQAWRRGSLRKAERWLLDHFDGSDGVGAIFPPMVYTIMALKCLGYSEDSAEFRWAEKQLDDLMIEENGTVRLQPCVSPVWDTAIAGIALADSGTPADDPALARAAEWLLAKEIREPGDWAMTTKGIEPTGWAFEYRNRFYADLDDTAMVALALARTARRHEPAGAAALRRAVAFLKAMQSRDGGWAAFDKDIDNRVLEAIPFADHNAMLDPTCADITARVLEAFALLGIGRGDPSFERGVQYLLRDQESDGAWYGRWGVNYVYGTWQALLGLAAAGFEPQRPEVRRATAWLVSKQQPDGGWGESPGTYDHPAERGRGQATASQTAWGLMGLIAGGEAGSAAARAAAAWLLRTQRPQGGWDEPEFTGTGFPRVFYLRYHYYRDCFPLLALGRYARAAGPEARGV